MRRRILFALLTLGLLLSAACTADPAGEPAGEDLIVIGMCQVGAESD